MVGVNVCHFQAMSRKKVKWGHKKHWVTLSFAKTKVLSYSFKPKFGLKPNWHQK